MSKDWYCEIDGEAVGPMTARKVKTLAKAGTLTPEHRVRKESWTNWKRAGDIQQLWRISASSKSNTPATKANKAPKGANRRRARHPQNPSDLAVWMVGELPTLLVYVGLLALLAVGIGPGASNRIAFFSGILTVVLVWGAAIGLVVVSGMAKWKFPEVEVSVIPLTGLILVGALLLVGAKFAFDEAQEVAVKMNRRVKMRHLTSAVNDHFHNHNALPTPASYDDSGAPLLSWRVHILPYIEQQSLYMRFHLDEPWDSPHNRQLIKEIPKEFQCRGAEDGKTCFLAPVGERTFFGYSSDDPHRRRKAIGPEVNDTVRLTDDRLEDVGVIVEVAPEHAVTWTRPADWEARSPIDTSELMFRNKDGAGVATLDFEIIQVTPQDSPERIERLLLLSPDLAERLFDPVYRSRE